MQILFKKSSKSGQNYEIKLKNGPFSIQKSANFGQKMDKYQTKFGH